MKIDTKYWADYNVDTSIQSSDEKFSEKSTDLESTFSLAVLEWNSEAEDDNIIEHTQIQNVKKLANEFFKEEKWISINVIHAMICQES